MNILPRCPRAAIFDFDGTIAESMYIWTDAPRELILRHGGNPPKNLLEIIAPMVMDETMKWIHDNFAPDCTIQELTEEIYSVIRIQYARFVQPKPGAVDVIRRMHQNGTRLCVLSATPVPLVSSALKRFGIADLFEFIACSDDWGGKSHCQCYTAAAKRLGIDPKDTIVFEDALHAARSAISAGFMLGAVYDASSDSDWPELKRISDWSGMLLLDWPF